MMLNGLRFHHFGLATRSLEKSTAFLESCGYKLGPSVFDPEQSVRLVFAEHDTMPAVELVTHELGMPGPVDVILETNATALYHLAYGCRNIDQAVEQMRAGGFRMVCAASPKPAVLFAGIRVAFYMVKDFGLIELIEEGE